MNIRRAHLSPLTHLALGLSQAIPSKALIYQLFLRARTRRQLACLDPSRLEDLGISAAEARREAARPFWR